MNSKIQRILMVGNAAGGKTKLSRRLAQIYNLPLTHVDSIQFLPGMKIRPLDETRKVLAEVTEKEKWIIDGHGPLDQIENRFQVADHIVFIDLPLWIHFWWATKRQIQSFWKKRPELPEGCSEMSWAHTQKLFKTMWKIHQQMRPQLIRIFSQESLKNKVTIIRTVQDLDWICENGLPELKSRPKSHFSGGKT